MTPTFDPQQFFGLTDNVALHVGASEIFGVLKRSMDLPAKWAALVTRTAGDHVVVPESGTVDGADAEDVMFARVSPIDVSFEEMHITTHDRFSCNAEVSVRVALIAERGELLAFQKTIVGSHRAARTERIGEHLQPAVRSTLAKLAAGRDVEKLVDSAAAEDIARALEEAVKAQCFSAGLKLARPPAVRFVSETYRQVRQVEQEKVRRRAEHDAARQVREALEQAQARHVDHLAAMLTRLGDLARSSPDVELSELIRTFAESQRGELYAALFATRELGSSTRWLVVAAGQELLFFDPNNPAEPDRRLIIDGPAGAVRSIQNATEADGGVRLLLGAATGVYSMSIDDAQPDVTLVVPGARGVRGGFNSAVAVGDRVFGSHSELGLYEWNLARPGDARPRFESITRGAGAVRHVQFSDGRLYCAIDDRVIQWPADYAGDKPTQIYTGSPGVITALCAASQGTRRVDDPTYAASRGLFAGTSDGDILRWVEGRESEPERLHPGNRRAAESLWLLSSSGVHRIVFADTSPRVRMQVLGDTFACEYEAGGQTLRRVEVATDIVVATNELRDRLICWTPGQPARPAATIGISSLCGRSIQDVCLVPHM